MLIPVSCYCFVCCCWCCFCRGPNMQPGRDAWANVARGRCGFKRKECVFRLTLLPCHGSWLPFFWGRGDTFRYLYRGRKKYSVSKNKLAKNWKWRHSGSLHGYLGWVNASVLSDGFTCKDMRALHQLHGLLWSAGGSKEDLFSTDSLI